MSIERYKTSHRWSVATVHNGTAYITGQVASDLDCGVKEQTQQTLEKIDGILADLGSDKSKILMATIYMKDVTKFKEMNEAWDEWVAEGNAPARACIEAAANNPDELVEIIVTAAVD